MIPNSDHENMDVLLDFFSFFGWTLMNDGNICAFCINVDIQLSDKREDEKCKFHRFFFRLFKNPKKSRDGSFYRRCRTCSIKNLKFIAHSGWIIFCTYSYKIFLTLRLCDLRSDIAHKMIFFLSLSTIHSLIVSAAVFQWNHTRPILAKLFIRSAKKKLRRGRRSSQSKRKNKKNINRVPIMSASICCSAHLRYVCWAASSPRSLVRHQDKKSGSQ